MVTLIKRTRFLYGFISCEQKEPSIIHWVTYWQSCFDSVLYKSLQMLNKYYELANTFRAKNQ